LIGISRRKFSRRVLGSMAAGSYLGVSMKAAPEEAPARVASLTDVDGILVGHCTLSERPTGCTVITARAPFTAGVDVRGGAPGTRETDLLRAENLVGSVNAILLSGGSAFGLDAAAGVVRWLEEQGLGFEVGQVRVPIVCGAILFDLFLGDPKIRPDARAGYEAAKAASSAQVKEGNVGAGAGCTVGKVIGAAGAMKAGLGTWSLIRADGLTVGALVAVNCFGDVIDPARGKIIAGARRPDGKGYVDAMEFLRRGREQPVLAHENTVIGVVATNAALNKAQCNKVAQMAQDALARCINPAHTPWDGDTVFAISSGRFPATDKPVDAGLIGALAADVLATAILRAVEKADAWGAYPSSRSLARGR
jgi:L-aminopeptidase/D-esterase-like protein